MAKEIKKDRREDLFAATPPLGAKKILFSLWASILGMFLDFGDVVRAHFHAKAIRRVYVALPKEDIEDGKCGVLKKTMYGTRDAAQNWEMEYTKMMINAGFVRGWYSACIFYHGERNEQSSTEVISQCLDQGRVWIGSVELCNKEWKSKFKPDWNEASLEQFGF